MLSILIFTRDRNKDLEELLNSLSLEKIKYTHEVIIVDNCENYSAKYFVNKFDIKYFHTKSKKLSSVFNFGWMKCSYENILFLADDVILENNWFINSKDYIENSNYDILGGPIISSSYPAGLMHKLYLNSKNNFISRFFLNIFLFFSFDKDPFMPGMLCSSGSYTFGASLKSSCNLGKIEVDLLTTSTMLIRKKILNKLSGFDEIFNFNHADGDFFIRAKKHNFKILFDSNLISHHKVRLGPSRSPYNISRDTFIFYKKHVKPKNLRYKIGAILNLVMILLLYFKQSILCFNLDVFKSLAGYLNGLSTSLNNSEINKK